MGFKIAPWMLAYQLFNSFGSLIPSIFGSFLGKLDLVIENGKLVLINNSNRNNLREEQPPY